MVALLLLLAPIGLLDSTSIIPLCIVPIIALLAGPRPLLGASALILGVFAVYLACGLLVLFGLQSAFDAIDAYVIRLWKDPSTEELVFQIVLGLVACAFGFRLVANRARGRQEAPSAAMTPAQAWLAGAGLTIVGLPGAVPYFAAIDLVLRADVALARQLAALVYYNAVFVAPLFAIVALRLVLGGRGDRVLDAVKRFFDTWGHRVIVALLFILGAVLVADGIGWFLGWPLIPV
jgi:hypothetical protein